MRNHSVGLISFFLLAEESFVVIKKWSMANRAINIEKLKFNDIPHADIVYVDTPQLLGSRATSKIQEMRFAFVLYLLLAGVGILMFGAATGISSHAMLPILSIFGGFGVGLLLIYYAATVTRGVALKIFLYAAAYILLFEVVEMVDALVAHPKR